jgi:hypothetical protein
MLDTGTTIVGLIIIAVCVASFMWMSRSGKSKHGTLLKMLESFAQQSGYALAQSDACATLAIALDASRRKLFFLKKRGQKHDMQLFDLSEYDKSYVISDTRSAGEKGELKAVDRLVLVLSAGKRKQSDAMIEFYNVEYDSLRLMGESQLIERWSVIVNEAIANVAGNK